MVINSTNKFKMKTKKESKVKTIIVLLMVATLFSSCKEDYEKKGYLVGTKWERTSKYNEDLKEKRYWQSGDWSHVFEFSSKDKVFDYYARNGHVDGIMYEYKYSYSYPKLIIYADTADLEFEFSNAKEFNRVIGDVSSWNFEVHSYHIMQ